MHTFQSIAFFVTIFAGLSAVRDIAQSLSGVGLLDRTLVDPLILLVASFAVLAGLGYSILGNRS